MANVILWQMSSNVNFFGIFFKLIPFVGIFPKWSNDGHQVVTKLSESQNYDQSLRPKYLGQRYTIPQTFQPFRFHIFKIPKLRIQLRFLLKLESVTWDHVSHVDTWPHAFLATLRLVRGVL